MKNQQKMKIQQKWLFPYSKTLRNIQNNFKLKQNKAHISVIDHDEKKDFIRIEIKVEKIKSLFVTQQICIEDLHCLDTNAKQILHAICLKSCLPQTQVQTKKIMTLFSLYNDPFKLGETL